jgi:hypothetical protein
MDDPYWTSRKNRLELKELSQGVNLSQKVGGGGGGTPNYEGPEAFYPKYFFNFGTLKRHSQRFRGTYKVILQCA